MSATGEMPSERVTPAGHLEMEPDEHRMFSFITMNWRGRPLTTYRTIIELISATTTDTGLHVRAERDTEWYEKGVKITDTEMQALPLTLHQWHGDWNYTLTPAPTA